MRHDARNIDFTSVESLLPEIQRLQRKMGFIEDLYFEIKTDRWTNESGITFTTIIVSIWCISKSCFIFHDTFWDRSTNITLATDNKSKFEQLSECIDTIISK